VIALAPPLRFTSAPHIRAWADASGPLIAVIPEWDQFCPPDRAHAELGGAPGIQVVVVPGARHLWTGERAVRAVLDQIADAIVPGSAPLPTTWDGPFTVYHPTRSRKGGPS
jgi:hypothetical protein